MRGADTRALKFWFRRLREGSNNHAENELEHTKLGYDRLSTEVVTVKGNEIITSRAYPRDRS